jgi:hypothetical protein
MQLYATSSRARLRHWFETSMPIGRQITAELKLNSGIVIPAKIFVAGCRLVSQTVLLVL